MPFIQYVELTRSLFPDQPPYQWTRNDTAPWTPITKPLSESRIVLIGSGGIYRQDQPPFDPVKNDLSFREIPRDTAAAELRIRHDFYDHRDADRDVNCVFPLERLRELAGEGFIGHLADVHFSFMGRIFRKTRLQEEMLPRLVGRLRDLAVDLAFLVPA